MNVWKKLQDPLPVSMQGSAPITGLLETSSESEDSEIEEVQKLDMKDVSNTEKLFITGVLDELKLCFNYSTQVKVLLKWLVEFALAQVNLTFPLTCLDGPESYKGASG